ncbi:hypothetical protein OEZ86_006225 [Tetradesmus obliquus]|nr:hypothetical protein OEZ86_006225 [Tetradesmus obliquus]
MDGKRRKDIEEALLKRDVKRQKLAEGKNVPELVQRVNEANAAALRRRTKMMLPAPQVSEAELEAIARMGEGATLEAELAAGAGGEATRQLLGEYQTPARFATPMRTPRTTVGGQDSLMQQAANLAKLRDLQTPLLGGENPELVGMDYSGIVPQRSTAATPNPLAAAAAAAGMTPAGPGMTPGLGRAGSGSAGGLLGATPGRAGSGSIAGVASTPSALAIAGGATPGGAALLASVRGGGSIPGATPMRIRDQFGLNEGLGEGLEGASLRAQRAAAAALRSDLRSGLAGLPAPENEYSVALPELPEDEAEAAVEEDAADVKARRAREAEAARQAEERKKSQVLQRGLPRPSSIQGLPQPKAPAELAAMSLRERAEAELAAELAALVEHDNAAYPAAKEAEGKGKKDKKRRAKDADAAGPQQMVRPLQQFDLAELDAARALLAEETQGVVAAMGHDGVAAEEYFEAWRATADEWVLDGKGGAVRKASATPAMRLDVLRRSYEATRREMEAQAHRAARLDKKAAILVAGLQTRHGKLTGQLEEVAQQVHDAQIELTAFQALQQQEQLVAPDRIERLKLLLQGQRDREVALQQQFRQLGQQRDDLREALQAAQQQQKQQQQQAVVAG